MSDKNSETDAQQSKTAAGSHTTVVVSKPGAGIRIERVVLSESTKKGLSTGVEWLDAPAKKT